MIGYHSASGTAFPSGTGLLHLESFGAPLNLAPPRLRIKTANDQQVLNELSCRLPT
ncbi:hypothetical protein PGT21_031914 [Puccinia graminis f. sp. tritici]|uniref:Uncharacterized protein n=1 Tax=Puccinia graminis f. sp. tritici TaxID=56615 RepID=A0A5B0R262_PUCGR|nr:hypothetical protein PGTUg99_032633 [Puccinia graminis f. sp. tritici]KAA1119691.1 hypothetical protein PGT21_031914 [Puccinia graminis f. sp. tritici]